MKSFILTALVAVFLCQGVVGCTTIETLGDYINENPAFANIATRQAVAQYIAAVDTVEGETQRAEDVQRRVTSVLAYIDGNPTANADSLMSVINKKIDWGELSKADRLLVQDIVLLVETEIRKHHPQDSPLSGPTSLAIKTIFKTAISAADIYLRR